MVLASITPDKITVQNEDESLREDAQTLMQLFSVESCKLTFRNKYASSINGHGHASRKYKGCNIHPHGLIKSNQMHTGICYQQGNVDYIVTVLEKVAFFIKET